MGIQKIIRAKEKNLGDNFIIKRSLPDVDYRLVGPFIFWDHMGPAKITPEKPMKVRAHPHIGLATITYLFSGEIMHRDSLGNEQLIVPGEVNWMTAGKGIVHSERSHPDTEIELEGIQLWLALPKEHEKVEANFYHAKEKDLPLIEEEGVTFRLIAGEWNDVKSPVPVYSPLFYSVIEMQGGSEFKKSLKENEQAGVYLISGELASDGQDLQVTELAIFTESVELFAKTKVKLMLFGGEVFPEPRHIWWNFVATDKELIEQAKSDWQAGSFPDVINEDEMIPLPEN